MEGSEVDESSHFKQRSCLLCLQSCLVKEEEGNFGKEWDLVGAGSNVLLKKHLQQMFVLRRVLEVPATLCERLLQKLGEDGGGVGGVEGDWFRVCYGCTERVNECWRLYQEILRLQGKMEEIKGGVRRQLEEEVRRSRKMGKDDVKIDWIEDEIYGVLFPRECPVEEVCVQISDEDPANEEICSNYSFEWDQADVWEKDDEKSDSDSSYDPDNEPKPRGPGRPPTKRGPGRPPTKTKTEPLVKRRRGRPPRKLDPSSVSENPIQASLPPKEKRPRGRPRLAKNYLSKFKQARVIKGKRPDPWNRCTLCPSKFLVPELLTSHLEAHKICDEFTCSECSFPALTSDELEHHKRTRHTPNGFHRQCPECSFIGSVRYLKLHMLENHPESQNNSKSSTSVLCSICSKLCASNQALSNHQRKMHPEQFGDTEKNVKCKQCGLLFPSRIRLQYHIRNTHLKVTKVVCDICGKGFTFRNELKRHTILKHKDTPKGDYICSVCGLDFQYAVTLTRHTERYHSSSSKDDGGDEASKAKGQQGPPEEFQCKYCDVKSPFTVVIRRHMKTHIDQIGHKCDLCERSYTSEQGLKRHLRINHQDGSEKVKCSHCMKEFQHVDYLKGHQKLFCPILKLKKGDVDSSTE